MTTYVIRRVIATIPILFFVSLMGFLVSGQMQGEPGIDILGPEATPEQLERIRDELRLDEPIYERYVAWIGGVVQWDFGESVQTGQSVTEEVSRRLPVTASIAGGAMVIALAIGIPAGLLQGARPGTWVDRIMLCFVSLGLATPGFWIGTMLISLFAIRLGWLPSLGYVPLFDSPSEWFKHAIMPIIAMGTVAAAEIARQVRTGVTGVMQQDYIRGARARGLREGRIVTKHGLKNGAMPALTLTGLRVGHLLAGTVIIEQMFSIPGMGTYTYQAIITSDVQVIQAVIIVFALIIVFVNLLTDIGYAYLDPKVRFG